MPLQKIYQPITNYIYLHHTDTLLIIPTYPENIQDSNSASFASNSVMGRSAPIFSYSNSGPRTISIVFRLHREMMDQVNKGLSNAYLNIGDDYVDAFIKQIQAAVLPKYASSTKMIDPPLVSLRISDDIYITGIINGAVGVDYDLPILYNNKYAVVSISFQITEVDPYDAESVMDVGSYRNMGGEVLMTTSLESPNYYSRNTRTSGSSVRSQEVR